MKTQKTLQSSPFLRPILQQLQDGLDHPALHPPILVSGSQSDAPQDYLKLAVAYNGSPGSHAALDLALWMAHQTRIATSQIVALHVVFVGDPNLKSNAPALSQADVLLHQARALADEWRGQLHAHLRFGDPAAELKTVVAQEGIQILIVGCRSSQHPLVRLLGNCPAVVLGIPETGVVPSETVVVG
ncbi:universal stress protein [Synechococcus sp. Nb3U1]|uniref:universal stress protein n=1 Tax=Synechococcus sp. Nb3U1 TaxID=1914529 RepID=UPI001F2BF155|nr:universal stress protein [Synechococcus sp. Nb3U1]MCF2970387.1 universal stress protein [Synechococcus sp. Nb3U1]